MGFIIYGLIICVILLFLYVMLCIKFRKKKEMKVIDVMYQGKKQKISKKIFNTIILDLLIRLKKCSYFCDDLNNRSVDPSLINAKTCMDDWLKKNNIIQHSDQADTEKHVLKNGLVSFDTLMRNGHTKSDGDDHIMETQKYINDICNSLDKIYESDKIFIGTLDIDTIEVFIQKVKLHSESNIVLIKKNKINEQYNLDVIMEEENKDNSWKQQSKQNLVKSHPKMENLTNKKMSFSTLAHI